MPKIIEVFVGPSDMHGVVPLVYVHADPVSMPRFGVKEAPRVSNVRFDFGTQEYVGELLDGREIARNEKRSAVTDTEHAVISSMFARGEEVPGGWMLRNGHLERLPSKSENQNA